MKKKLNLAQKPDKEMPETAEGKGESEPNYPTLSIMDHPDASVMGIPDEGTSLIKHKVISRSENMRGGKKRHSVTLEVHSIEPTGGAPKKKHTALPGAKEDMDAVDAGLE